MRNQCKNTYFIFFDGDFKRVEGGSISKMRSDCLSLITTLSARRMEDHIHRRYWFRNADNDVRYTARNTAQTGLFGNVSQHKSGH